VDKNTGNVFPTFPFYFFLDMSTHEGRIPNFSYNQTHAFEIPLPRLVLINLIGALTLTI
jgi:hypothetical protein